MAPQGVDVLNVLLGATDTPMLRERLRLSGISAQAIKLALPDEVARSAIDQLAHGPTYVAYADPEDSDILTSAQARRARVLSASQKFASLLKADCTKRSSCRRTKERIFYCQPHGPASWHDRTSHTDQIPHRPLATRRREILPSR